MTHGPNREVIHQGLAQLDALVDAYPELRSPHARTRLTHWLKECKGMADGKTQQLYARVPQDLIDALDRYTEQMKQQHPGLDPNRSDAIRALLYKALTVEGLWPPATDTHTEP